MLVKHAEMMLCPHLGKNCVTEVCMMWEFTKKQQEADVVTCHRCYEKVNPKGRNTCPRCDAFIRGYGAEIPMVDMDRDEMEGYCTIRGGCCD